MATNFPGGNQAEYTDKASIGDRVSFLQQRYTTVQLEDKFIFVARVVTPLAWLHNIVCR